jgi:hypothetical protein
MVTSQLAVSQLQYNHFQSHEGLPAEFKVRLGVLTELVQKQIY